MMKLQQVEAYLGKKIDNFYLLKTPVDPKKSLGIKYEEYSIIDKEEDSFVLIEVDEIDEGIIEFMLANGCEIKDDEKPGWLRRLWQRFFW